MNMYKRYVAQLRIAEALVDYTGGAARRRMQEDARDQKQSLKEIAMRRAGNLLDSYVTYKPGGEVTWCS